MKVWDWFEEVLLDKFQEAVNVVGAEYSIEKCTSCISLDFTYILYQPPL